MSSKRRLRSSTWVGQIGVVDISTVYTEYRESTTIDELAKQYEGTVKVGKLNIDENPQTPGGFRIHSIPAVLLFHNGKVVETMVGVQSKQGYEEALQRVIAA